MRPSNSESMKLAGLLLGDGSCSATIFSDLQIYFNNITSVLYRVLGILAVTRSFGDHGMKDFVTAQPHVVETDLSTHGECPFLILACDGTVYIILHITILCSPLAL